MIILPPPPRHCQYCFLLYRLRRLRFTFKTSFNLLLKLLFFFHHALNAYIEIFSYLLLPALPCPKQIYLPAISGPPWSAIYFLPYYMRLSPSIISQFPLPFCFYFPVSFPALFPRFPSVSISPLPFRPYFSASLPSLFRNGSARAIPEAALCNCPCS